MNKRGLFGNLIVAGVFLIAGFFWFVGERDFVEDLSCEIDDDCVKVQTGCCACNMGGEEICASREVAQGYLETLENCSEFTICAAVDKCEIESCGCVSGACVER